MVDGTAHHEGRFATISGVDAHSRPIQRPGPPIVIGAESGAALRRAVTTGDGWYGFDFDLPQCLEALRRVAATHERPPELGRLEITITPTGPIDRALVERYEELGVDRLVLLPQPDAERDLRHRAVPLDQIKRNIDWVARELLAP